MRRKPAASSANATPSSADQVVVGLSASVDDGLEDWSQDFAPPREGTSACARETHSVETCVATHGTRCLTGANEHTRPSLRWQPHSLQNNSTSSSNAPKEGVRRTVRRRKSSSESPNDPEHPLQLPPTVVASVKPRSSDLGLPATAIAARSDSRRNSNRFREDDDDDDFDVGLEVGGLQLQTSKNCDAVDENDAGDEDGEDEDWDVEFGFAEVAPDETSHADTTQSNTQSGGGGGAIDPSRRRAENFNIFLRNFHDMMDGEDLPEDDDTFTAVAATHQRRARKSTEEQLFQRRRNGHALSISRDGSFEGTTRASLTSSSSGSIEVSLVDNYRLLEVAGSLAYSVRIERYPKPCSTYSNLERDASWLSFTENQLEQYLVNLVRSKCDLVTHAMEKARAQTTNPRQQKNHQFRTLVSMPFGKELVVNFHKQVALYRYFGDEKSNRELVRVFFEKVSTIGIAEEDWSKDLTSDEYDFIVGCSIEILQEAARMYGPQSAVYSFAAGSPSPASSTSNATTFWMRQFQSILVICANAFPKFRNAIALIELRYVCHHLVGIASGDFAYTWQICNQLPPFCPLEPIAGESAPIIANDILEFYGALFAHLMASSPPTQPALTKDINANDCVAAFGICSNSICLQALVICDIQSLYESKSVLGEMTMPELAELFEFDDDDADIKHDVTLFDESHDLTTRLLELLKPNTGIRCSALCHYYDLLSATAFPLVKAKCASVLSGMHLSAASLSNLRVAESLAYEAIRLLERVTSNKLATIASDGFTSMFNNDGLLSDLGREVLEVLGNVLIKNQKYRYGVVCLEAARTLFSFMNQGMEYEKLDRLLCSLSLQADDVKRALPLHEKVAASTQRQGNINEYVYVTQVLINLWIREGHFSLAEEHLSSAFQHVRDQTSLLSPCYSATIVQNGYPSCDTTASITRSSTMMTASSSTSSSHSGSFYLSSRSSGISGELDIWLNHDISLHLLLRDIYHASGRCLEGMRVLEHLLNYSTRLPRGKRTHIRMLLAEDALKMCMFDTSRYMFSLLDQEANFFCDKLRDNSIINGSSSGAGSSSGGGSRSMGGMGSEARYCFDMVFSVRYIMCRAKLFLRIGDYRHAFAWLSLAHIKSEREGPRKQAKLHYLDGKVFLSMYCEQLENVLAPSQSETVRPTRRASGSIYVQVDDMLKAFSNSLYGLNRQEKERLQDRMMLFCECSEDVEKLYDNGAKAYWTAFEKYQTLDDGVHQLKALLSIIRFHLAPIERSFFVLGNSRDDDQMKRCLYHVTMRGSNDSRVRDGSFLDDVANEGDDVIEKTRKSLLEAQKLLRRAMNIAEQVAEPACFLQTLIYCSQTWVWLERIASYKSEWHLKESAALWDEAVKVLKAVFLRRVSIQDLADLQLQKSLKFGGRLNAPHHAGGIPEAFCVVPILNFREGFTRRLETMTLQLIFVACQLQQFAQLPESVEDVILTHLDELLSARMCLSSVLHQLRSFRAQQRLPRQLTSRPSLSASGGLTPSMSRSSTSSSNGDSHGRTASFTVMSTSSAHSSGGGSGTPSSSGGSGATQRKGHKKNQSMSSISELLTSGSSSTPSSSFHDVSNRVHEGSFLSTAVTPRTGLASLSERMTNTKHITPGMSLSRKYGHGNVLRHRGRSRSAPQPEAPAQKMHMKSPPYGDSSGISSTSSQNKQVVDLGDIHSWSSATGDLDQLEIDTAFTAGSVHNEGSSSGGAMGLYDFDEGQSERLWWIFNTWKDVKTKYTSGKIELSSYRSQNLRHLRILLDSFDPQQVAVLYVGGDNVNDKQSSSSGSHDMLGFDVAHMNSHALIQEKDLVLSIGYDVANGPQFGLGSLRFKVFPVREGDTASWREEIPRPSWYLMHHELAEAESASTGEGVLRTLRLFGAKLMLKLLGILLLENSVVVVGSSFAQVKEVTLSLLKLLQPFQWQHTFLPFLPVTSCQFLVDAVQRYVKTQSMTQSKGKKSLSHDWRWNASKNEDILDAGVIDEPPFLVGTTSDAWRICTQSNSMLSGSDDHNISSYVNVVNLDNLEDFSSAKNSRNACPLPRKWCKQFLERFEKVCKHRRKVQQKVDRRLSRLAGPGTPLSQSLGTPISILRPSPLSGSHLDVTHRSFDEMRSTGTHWLASPHMLTMMGTGTTGSTNSSDLIASDRLFYDFDCLAGFSSGLIELYEKLRGLCDEKVAKSKKSGNKSGFSKRQEIKSWFSSSHDYDSFLEIFQNVKMYTHFEHDLQQPVRPGTGPRSASSGSLSSSAFDTRVSSSNPMKRFGSMSSTSSGTGLPVWSNDVID